MDTDEFGIPLLTAVTGASERKRVAITQAAIKEFVQHGYSGASVESIAATSGVSKPTVYSHFGNKEQLFLAVIGSYLRDSYTGFDELADQIIEADDLRTALIEFAGALGEILLRDDLITLRRLVIGEVDRFPQLGELWAQISQAKNDEPLMRALMTLREQGRLDVPNPLRAVRQLIALTVGSAQLIHTLRPSYEFAPGELEDLVTSGVDVFLAAYAR
ncbi:TetR/AcrR family transcriptional regulator [Kribbella yunnanensis]|uniref:TetR/AcrR family transcriptional regulator n=1 Tax=Kribbella yunnanensis TaxID=190194 RepID=A0ABP4S9T1_9ACTN